MPMIPIRSGSPLAGLPAILVRFRFGLPVGRSWSLQRVTYGALQGVHRKRLHEDIERTQSFCQIGQKGARRMNSTAGHADDPDLGILGPHFAKELNPIHSGEENVAHQQVNVLSVHDFQRILAGDRRQNFMAQRAQCTAAQECHVRVIFNNEYR